MTFQCTKTYGANLGLSCAFRQWRAKSHCRFIHGYALEVKLIFEAVELDENQWVIDFGGLKSVKQWLTSIFDHQTVVALDDPELPTFEELARKGLIQVMYLPDVGCEAFAKTIGEYVCQWLKKHSSAHVANEDGGYQRVFLHSCEVREHGANSAVYLPPYGRRKEPSE